MQWRGIAICGIWAGVGITAFAAPDAVMGVAVCAVIATLFMS